MVEFALVSAHASDSDPLHSVAQILGASGGHVGMATLVNERILVTCAHVVSTVAGPNFHPANSPAITVAIRWPTHPEHVQRAQVLVEGWASEDEFGRGDLAILKLLSPPPADVAPAELLYGLNLESHSFRAYGAQPDGTPVRCDGTIRGREGPGGTWIRIESRAGVGPTLSPGFSGSAVFDADRRGVVGIVIARDTEEQARSAFFLPCDQIAAIWRPLETHVLTEFERSVEAREHWLPRARGVGSSAETGWFFSGRRAIVEELTASARGVRSTSNYFCVAGSPGAGKSAILARLPVIADRRLATMAAPGIDDLRLSGVDVIAIYMRQMSFGEVLATLAERIGIAAASAEGVIDSIRRRRRVDRALIVVLDGLDEAADTDARKRIARDLIRRLGIEAERLGITVIVSCRSGVPDSENEELIRLLGGRCERVQADSEEYVSREDFVSFAEARLLAQEEDIPIWSDEERVVEVAEKVADAAYPVYLVAQLVTRSLIEDPDLTERDLENRTYPSTVGEAFEEYLARFGHDERRLRDLLAGLSHARGTGFTRGSTWLEVVSSVSGRSYVEQDLDWLLESGAAFLVETVETDQAPRYRLYHQALVDMLQEPTDAPKVYELMRRRVAAGVDDRYLRTHLSGHAVAAAMISEFLLDPVAVTACDITIALRDAARAGQGISAEADNARLALSSVAYELETCPSIERPAYLGLAGHQYGVPTFTGRAAQSWWNAWYADWDVASEHRLLERGRPYTSVTIARSGVDDVVVAADADGVVTFRWADDRAEAFGQISLGGVVTCLSASAVGEDHFVVGIGTDYGEVHAWDSVHQTPRRIARFDGAVTSIALRGNRRTKYEVLATSSDGSIEKQARTFARRTSRVRASLGVPALSCCFASDRDTFIAVGTAGSGIAMLRHEDLSRDKSLGAPDAGYVDALYPWRFEADQELSVVAASTAAFGVWGLEFGFSREQFLDSNWSGRGSTLFAENGERLMAAAVGHTIYAQYGTEGSVLTLRGHEDEVRGLAIVNTDQVELISVSNDGSMRSWPLGLDRSTAEWSQVTKRNQVLALSRHEGQAVVTTSAGETLVVSNQGTFVLQRSSNISAARFPARDRLMIRYSELAEVEMRQADGIWSVDASATGAPWSEVDLGERIDGASWHIERPIEYEDGYLALGDEENPPISPSEMADAVSAHDLDAAYLLASEDSELLVLACDPAGVAIVKGTVSDAGYPQWHWQVVCQRRDFAVGDLGELEVVVVSDDSSFRVIVCDTDSLSVLDQKLDNVGRIVIGGGAAQSFEVAPRGSVVGEFNFAVHKRAGLIIGDFRLE